MYVTRLSRPSLGLFYILKRMATNSSENLGETPILILICIQLQTSSCSRLKVA